jgi:hypothetical protein
MLDGIAVNDVMIGSAVTVPEQELFATVEDASVAWILIA